MLALAGGTVYTDPFSDPIRDGVVLIEGETISYAGERDAARLDDAAEIVDCSGMTVTAGFWNCHVHFFERKWANAGGIPADELAEQLREYTRFGFTSVFDLGSAWENTRIIRDRVDGGEVDGPAIYSTGQVIIPPGAMPPESVLRVLGTVPAAPLEAADAAEATSAANLILSQDTDALKLFASGNAPGQKLSRSALRAAVARAHVSQKPVFAHTNDADDVLAALDAGVDVIAHTTPRSGAWNGALLEKAVRANAALTPTLALWGHLMRHDRISLARQLEQTAVEQLRSWIGAGATVLFGTDAGAVDTDPSREFALMREAGMSFAQILASLTVAPAARFGSAAVSGRIASGCAADVTVFESPFTVRHTIRAGRRIHG